MKLKLLALTGLVCLSGCAVAPESIAPEYVSTIPYENYTCKQLGEESARLDSAYTVAAAQQDKARTDDTVGVLLIGIPVSSMSGANVAPQIANLKGQQQAVQQSIIAKNCTPTGDPGVAPVSAPREKPRAIPKSSSPADEPTMTKDGF